MKMGQLLPLPHSTDAVFCCTSYEKDFVESLFRPFCIYSTTVDAMNEVIILMIIVVPEFLPG